MKLFKSFFLLFFPMVVLAQNPSSVVRIDYDMQKLAAPPRLSATELSGRKLFAQYCALCHDPVGQPTGATYGPLLSLEYIKAVGETKVRDMILKGSSRMPGFQYQFEGDEINQVIAYLKTVSADSLVQKPTVSAGAGSQKERSIKDLDENTKASARLQGTVHAATGEALAGIAVSARAQGTTVSTTVFTNDSGKYYFPRLNSGQYKVWAQAVGYEEARADETLGEKQPTHLPLKLTAITRTEDILPQLSSAEWLNALPSKSYEDQRMKEIFRINCSDCHQANLVLQRRFDKQGWRSIIDFMPRVAGLGQGWLGPDTESSSDGYESDLTDTVGHYRDELATYLARVRGPGSTMPSSEIKLLPRPTGKAARVVITGYDIPPAETPSELAWHNGEIWSDGAAAGLHGTVGIHDLTIDNDGDVWIVDSVPNDARQVVKVTAATGQVTGFKLPEGGKYLAPQLADVHGITRDSQGILWFEFDRQNRLGRIDPATETFQFFKPHPRMGRMALTTDTDANDKVWISAVYGALRFDPDTEKFSYYQNRTPADGFTYGVAGDAIGNGWWTQFTAGLVAMADVKTGETHEFVMRPPWNTDREALATPADKEFYESSGASLAWGGSPAVPGEQAPRRLGADKKGDTVWVPNWWGSNLAEINIHSKEVTYHKLPFFSQPYFVSVDKNHVVWTNLASDDRVAAFDQKTKQWTIYRLPINGCESRNIAVDDLRGDVWVPCYRASKIFRLQFRTAEWMQSMKAGVADEGA